MAATFFVVLRQLVVPEGESETRLPARAAARLGVPAEDILSCRPVRRSLDSRKRRGKAVMVYHLRLELPARRRKQLRAATHLDLLFETGGRRPAPARDDPAPQPGRPRPLVVGAGPAGMFAALRLARAGWKPILVERGDGLDDRRRRAADFWRSGRLDPESNVLFGIGGAGLFSDGKLNTRHKDREGMAEILHALIGAGAPESVAVDAEPHLGSDLLGDVVDRIMARIREAGGEIRTRRRLEGLRTENGAVRQAVLRGESGSETLDVDAVLLAVGHSARDVHEMLLGTGAALEGKPFAIGLRVEMPQESIDASRRASRRASRPGRGGESAASFRLSRAPTAAAAACYTFCMCPGGLVIPCASEPGRLCVNGMSYHARAGEWANAAFLSPVGPADFAAANPGGDPRLAGVAFQRLWEERAFRAGLDAGVYAAPASTLADFVNGVAGPLPDRRSVARAAPANLRSLLPGKISATLAEAIPAMVSRLRGVDPSEVTLYGVETRTSSPIRMIRDASGMATGLRGLFPAGEGSGYAGGIMTSALDGWRAAANLMRSMGKTRNTI